MTITLCYQTRKVGRQGTVSEVGAILEAKNKPLGWGVEGANCDPLGTMMARRYLRDVIEKLNKDLRDQPNAAANVLQAKGVFDLFAVRSRRGYWKVTVTMPDNYPACQVISDARCAKSKGETCG